MPGRLRPRCRGASTATPRWPSPAYSEEAAKEAGFDVVATKHRCMRQRPGPDHRRDRGPGEGHRREAARRHGRARSSACTWSGPWVTEQLGQGYLAVNWEATRRRGRPLHPAPPDAVRERSARRCWPSPGAACTADLQGASHHGRHHDAPARRDRHRGHHHQVVQAGRRPGRRGRGRSSRCRPTRSTPRCRRPSPGYLTEILVPEGDTVDVGTRLAVLSAEPGRRRRRARLRPRRPPRPRRGARARGRAAEPEPAEAAAAAAARRRRPPSRGRRPGRRPRRLGRAAAAPAPTPGPRRPAGGGAAGRVLSPVVRRLIAEHGLDPAAIDGHRRRRPHHPRRRARAPSTGRRRRPAAPAARRGRARRRAGPPPPRPGTLGPRRAGGRRRAPASATRSIPFTNIRTPHGRAHGPLARPPRPTRYVAHRGRLRGRRAGPPGPQGRVQGRGGRSASPTCRSSPGRSIDALARLPARQRHRSATTS